MTVPALPGLVTEGDCEEAKAMAEKAVVGYLESQLGEGIPAPVVAQAGEQALAEHDVAISRSLDRPGG